jgi:hypothetical protein
VPLCHSVPLRPAGGVLQLTEVQAGTGEALVHEAYLRLVDAEAIRRVDLPDAENPAGRSARPERHKLAVSCEGPGDEVVADDGCLHNGLREGQLGPWE